MIRIATFVVLAGALCAQTLFRGTRTLVLPARFGHYDTAVGDVDGDGDPDLVQGNDYDRNQLFLNLGRGVFVDATTGRLPTPSSQQATTAVALVDLDRDGDLDLLVTNDDDFPNRVYENDGRGYFTDVSATALPPNQYYSLDHVVADFDGDGDPDWLVQDVGATHLYLNDGTGKFKDFSVTHVPAALQLGDGGVAVDLDADGDLDVLCRQVALINDGLAHFVVAPASFLPVKLDGYHFVGDVDGDGKTDLFLRAQGLNRHVLVRNLGGGHFADVTTSARLPARPDAGHGLALDVDGDGDLDVVGNGWLCFNDGTGRFTDASDRMCALVPDRILHADLDDDGDEDLFQPYGAVCVNFLHQVDAPLPPRPGQSYPVDFWVRPGDGQQGALVVPALAPTGAVVPAGGLGSFYLDPATTIVLGAHIVPAQSGRFRYLHQVPLDPILVGTKVLHQALVVEGTLAPRLTNAIEDRIQR